MKFLILLILVISCLNNPSCNNKGNYIESINDCKCQERFITYPEESELKCNYELKSKNVTKFLSLIFGIIGADQFYLGNNFKAMFKVLFPLFLFYVILKAHENRKFTSPYR
jgi:hypothetical protein